MTELEKKLAEARSQCRERELQLVCQKKKEKELVTTVQRYEQLLGLCPETGVFPTQCQDLMLFTRLICYNADDFSWHKSVTVQNDNVVQ